MKLSAPSAGGEISVMLRSAVVSFPDSFRNAIAWIFPTHELRTCHAVLSPVN